MLDDRQNVESLPTSETAATQGLITLTLSRNRRITKIVKESAKRHRDKKMNSSRTFVQELGRAAGLCYQ